MSILSNTTFLVGLVFLCYYTYVDYKRQEIENKAILGFVVISCAFLWINTNFWINLSLMAFLSLLGLYLWNIKAIGGADVKILPFIVPFLGFHGLGESLGGMMLFLTLFACLGGLYGLAAKFIVKKKEIPLLPIILLTYIIFFFFRYY